MNLQATQDEICRLWKTLFREGDVVEIRIPKAGRYGTISGYFNSPEEVAKAINQHHQRRGGGWNIYFTISPTNPVLLARCKNRLQERAESTTNDADIPRRRTILLDFDAARPAGISSNEFEHEQALERAAGCQEWLNENYAICSVRADSGNGGHLLIPVDLPNDEATRTLVERFLHGVAFRYDDDVVHVDKSVHNASRIAKMPGTKAVKGDDTEDRPHRFARLLDIPDDISPASIEALTQIGIGDPHEEERSTTPPRRVRNGDFSITEWMEKHGIAIYKELPYLDGRKFQLVQCPFNPEHKAPDSVIIERGSGRLGFKCLHNSCEHRDWEQLRDLMEPDRKKDARSEPRPKREATPNDTTGNGRPTIETNSRQLRDISQEALDALIARNTPPEVFMRGGSLVRVHVDEHRSASIRELTQPSLRGILARSADWISTSEKRGIVDVSPPPAVVDDVLSLPAWLGIPPLSGIVTAPVFANDGTLETTQGYHSASRLIYHAEPPTEIPDTTPTPTNAKKALSLIMDDWLGQFPFVDASSKANALALYLLPFVREMIVGPTPLHLIDAPSPGSGKSLLAKTVVLPFSPPGAMLMTEGDDEDEWRKRITSALRNGPSHIFIDNIRKRVTSTSLAAALTLVRWDDRILGESKTTSLPNRAVWIGTGNNLQLSDEITRRSVWIRLDAKEERPWLREGFSHDLDTWTPENRPALIASALTIIRAWIQAGQPRFSGKQLGSFERWSAVLGGILEVAGVAGFMENATELYDRLDPEREAWSVFLHNWFEAYQRLDGSNITKAVGAKELIEVALTDDLLLEYLGNSEKPQGQKVVLGAKLRNRCDRLYTYTSDGTCFQYRMQKGGEAKRAMLYTVSRIVGESSESSESPQPHMGGVSDHASRTRARATPPDTTQEPTGKDSPDSPDSPVLNVPPCFTH